MADNHYHLKLANEYWNTPSVFRSHLSLVEEDLMELLKMRLHWNKVALREGCLQTSSDCWMWMSTAGAGWPETWHLLEKLSNGWWRHTLTHLLRLSLCKQSLFSSQSLGSSVRHIANEKLHWPDVIFLIIWFLCLSSSLKWSLSSPSHSGICVAPAYMHHYHLIIRIVKGSECYCGGGGCGPGEAAQPAVSHPSVGDYSPRANL